MRLKNQMAQTNIAWKLIKANGLDPDIMFEKAGIDSGLLSKPQARVACSKINNLFEIATSQIKDPCFAIRAGEHWHPSYLNALGYAWLVCESLAAAFKKFIRYSRIISDSMKVSLNENQNETEIIFQYRTGDTPHPNRRVVYSSVFMEMCRANYGINLTPLLVRMVNDQTVCKKVYESYFKSDIVFSQPYDSFVFSSNDVQRALPSANTELARMHDQVMRTILVQLNEADIIQQVKGEIFKLLSSGKITDDIVANELNMSVRTLQRKLKNEGTTFRYLLDDTRKKITEEYIADPGLRLEEIAFLTGFSEYSSFSRAFKRWTNSSPKKVREALTE